MLLMVMDSARLPGTTYHTSLYLPTGHAGHNLLSSQSETGLLNRATLSLTTWTEGQCCKSRTPIEECQGGACFVQQLVLIFFIEKWIFMPIISRLSSDLFSEMQDNVTHCTTALHWKIYSLLHLPEMEWRQ